MNGQRGGQKRKKLEHLHILIHIPDMAQLNQTLANLSVTDDNFDIDHLDITVEIGAADRPNNAQREIDAATTTLEQTNAGLTAAIPKEK